MWSVTQPSKSTAHLGRILPLKVLYQFDGPILFSSVLGLSQMLFFKYDEVEAHDLFLAVPTDPKTLSHLQSGRLSVRGALGYGKCFVVQMDFEGKVHAYWETQIDEMDKELLPDFGVGLDPRAPWVVDTVEQIDSFLSVRFSGSGLSRETIAFRTFMKLMESVYEAARGVLAPIGLEKARSSVFDFKIKEPVFGSLIVTIDEPSADLERVNKLMRRTDITTDDLLRSFERSRDDLFDGLTGLVESNPDDLDAAQSAARYTLIQKLVDLLPDNDSAFSKVEFNTSTSIGMRHVEIKSGKAASLREEYSKASQSVQEFLGTITIINDKSSTFVVQASFGREVTCHLSRTFFEDLQEDERFGTKALVRLYGEYNQRSRRDELFVKRPPVIVDRQ